MKLKIRLILSYMVLAIAGAMVLGIVYNHYTMEKYRSKLYTDLQFWENQMLNQYADSQRRMEQVASYILSDQDSLGAIRILSKKMATEEVDMVTINENKGLVRRNLNTAYIIDNFYRIIVFNQYGVIAASDNQGDKIIDMKKIPGKFPWIQQLDNTKGKFVLIGNHKDDWGVKDESINVYSIVKEIQGDNLGYIEIQKTIDSMDEIFSSPDEVKKIILVNENGTILYHTKGVNLGDYIDYLKKEDGIAKANINGQNELIAIQTSNDCQVKLLLIENWNEVMASIPNTFGMTSVITSAFLLFSICFIMITADRLTRPLRKLREKMEQTQLSNMGQDIRIESSDEDIQALGRSYQQLLARLDCAINKEKKLALLQMQAQFDTLQAQVNPHFIYNVLNVISARGIENDDEVICEICGKLAAILRYSTNTKERYATLMQETDYLSNYIFILKARFEERVSFEINMQKELEQVIVPKIVLQQLVENSIEHGYAGSMEKMEIQVNGYRNEHGWKIEVVDNGKGIKDDVILNLNESIRKIKLKLLDKNEVVELGIGGMGLLNTYARMFLLYQEDVIFNLNNRKNEKGTIVTIGVKGER